MSLCNCAACERGKKGIHMTYTQHIEQLMSIWYEREEITGNTLQVHDYFFIGPSSESITRPGPGEKVYCGCLSQNNQGWCDILILFKNLSDLVKMYCCLESIKPFTITEEEFKTYLTFS